jgi:hypothetical protein
MSILTAAQSAADVLSVARPFSLVGSADETDRTLLAIAHLAGDDIARRGDWSRMTMSANVSGGALPADFQRLVAGNAVNITAPTPAAVRGPLSNDQLAAISRMGASTYLYYALTGGAVQFSRALAGETITASYVSRSWLINGVTRRERAMADADETLFAERLLVSGTVWMWRRAKSQEYQDQLAEFEAMLAQELNADRGVTA